MSGRGRPIKMPRPQSSGLRSPLSDFTNEVLLLFVLFLVLSKIDEIRNQYVCDSIHSQLYLYIFTVYPWHWRVFWWKMYTGLMNIKYGNLNVICQFQFGKFSIFGINTDTQPQKIRDFWITCTNIPGLKTLLIKINDFFYACLHDFPRLLSA